MAETETVSVAVLAARVAEPAVGAVEEASAKASAKASVTGNLLESHLLHSSSSQRNWREPDGSNRPCSLLETVAVNAVNAVNAVRTAAHKTVPILADAAVLNVDQLVPSTFDRSLP